MNRRFLPILVLLSWLFARCAREVTIDLPGEETKVVAVCHFTSDELFRVRVTLSQPVYASQDPEVPERAEVTIAQEGTFLDKLYKATDDNGNIYWESRDLAQTGVPYSISVRVDGYPNAEATSTIPVPTALKPLQTDPDHITEVPLSDGRRLMNIPLALHLEKLPAGQRYFGFYLRHDLDVGRFQNGNWETDFTYEGIATNYSADGRTLSLLHDLSESEPLVLINEKYWSDNGDSLLLDARIAYNPAANEKPRRIMVEWRTLSEEFYRYHLSLDRQGGNLPLSDPDALYNNISGGYGNFSGYSVKTDTIVLPL